MNIKAFVYRAALMRATTPAGDGCRVPTTDEVEVDGRTTRVRELGFFVHDGEWIADPDGLIEDCGTEGCVVHLVIRDRDERDEHIVAKSYRPQRSLASLFRAGRSFGWFKGMSTYQN